MAQEKPTEDIGWIASGATRVEPSSGKKTTGFEADERPACEYFNWLFGVLGDWQKYLSEFPEAGAMGRGVLGVIELSYVSGTRWDVSAGTIITRVGRKAAIEADTDIFSASPPSANNVLNVPRLDLIVYTDDPNTQTGEIEYIEDAAATLATYADIDGDYTILAAIIVADDSSYVVTDYWHMQYRLAASSFLGRTCFLGDGKTVVSSDYNGLPWLQSLLVSVNRVGGGTVKLLGTAWDFTSYTSEAIYIPSRVTLDLGGTTIKPAAAADTIIAMRGEKYTAALAQSSGEWRITVSGTSLYNMGVGAFVDFIGGANGGIRMMVSRVISETSAALSDIYGGTPTGLTADAAVVTRVVVNRAALINGTLDGSAATSPEGLIETGYCEDVMIDDVRVTRTGSADGYGVHFRNANERVKLRNVHIDGDFTNALYGTSDTDNTRDSFAITHCNFGVEHSVVSAGTTKDGIYSGNIDAGGTIPAEWINTIIDGSIVGDDIAEDTLLPVNMGDRVMWCLASFSVNTAASGANANPIARDVQKTEDGTSVAVEYLTGAAFATTTASYPWQVRNDATGVYQIRPPVIITPGPTYSPYYGTTDVCISLICLGAQRMFSMTFVNAAGGYWEVEFEGHDGAAVDCGFQVMFFMVAED